MSLNALLTLFALAMAAGWTPGPNNALLAGSGVNFGLRRTVPHALGVALGFPLMVFIVGLFLGAAFQTSAMLRDALRYGGAAMLLWVAWKIASSGGLGSSSGPARPFRFNEAVAFQWINPKGWVMAIALTAQFVNPAHTWVTALMVAGVMLVAGFSSAFGWAALGTGLRRFLSKGRRMRVFDITMGVVIALGVAVLLRD
ncbi:MAG TPA: LysE family translocator [Acidocella sp.]|nr:LysE family translocator [Acidocella sp.]